MPTPHVKFHEYCEPVTQLTAEEKLKEAENYIIVLEDQVNKLAISRFGLERFGTDPKLLVFYTGFTSYALLIKIFHLLKPRAEIMTRWSQILRQRRGDCDEINTELSFHNEHLALVDQFFLFLVKVRLDLFQQDIAFRFHVSQSTVSRILITWANFLYFQLGSLPIWPSHMKVERHMPSCFTYVYPSTRVILDCTKI